MLTKIRRQEQKNILNLFPLKKAILVTWIRFFKILPFCRGNWRHFQTRMQFLHISKNTGANGAEVKV